MIHHITTPWAVVVVVVDAGPVPVSIMSLEKSKCVLSCVEGKGLVQSADTVIVMCMTGVP